MRPLWEIVREIFDGNRGMLPRKIAEATGYSMFHVLRWGEEPRRSNPNSSGSPVPAIAVSVITRLSGDPSLLREIADDAGYLIIKKPQEQEPTTVAQVVKEFGELLVAHSQALEDGFITDMERAKIFKEGYEAVEAILGLLQTINPSKEVCSAHHDSVWNS